MVDDVKKQLFLLLEKDDSDGLKYLLSSCNVEIDDKYENGRTLLHTACYLKKCKVVKMLINEGANINESNINGTTALMYAKTNLAEEDFDFLNILIDNGANIVQKDNFGKTVLDYISEQKNIKLLEFIKNKQ